MWPEGFIIFSIFGHLEQGNFDKSIKYLPNYVHNFAKYQIVTKEMAKNFLNVAQVVKYRQIWSRC